MPSVHASPSHEARSVGNRSSRIARATIAGLLGSCVLLGACTKLGVHAEVKIAIDAEAAVRAKAEDVLVVLEVEAPGGGWVPKGDPRRFEPNGAQAWPIKFNLGDNLADAYGTYQLRATAHDRQGAAVAQARVIREFRSGKSLSLQLTFEAACMFHEPCASTLTCHEARCVNARDEIAVTPPAADSGMGVVEDPFDGVVSSGADLPCKDSGARACAGKASSTALLCDGTAWRAQPTCKDAERCDNGEGERHGTCQPISPDCAGRDPDTAFCQNDVMLACPDLVATAARPCPPNEQCVMGSDGAHCACAVGFVPGPAGCREATDCGANNVGFCDSLTTCSMSQGKPQCTGCPTGYTGDGEHGCQPLLAALEPERGELIPRFDPQQREYRLRVPLMVQRVSIAFTAPLRARVEVNDLPLLAAGRWTSPMLGLGDNPQQVTVIADSGSSAAYRLLIERTGAQEAFAKANLPTANDMFGLTVGVSGDTLAVGAVYEDSAATGVNGNPDDESAANSGAAYVLTREGNDWVQQAYLKADDSAREDYFGTSIAIAGDTIAVGAIHDDFLNPASNPTRGGAAYVYVRSQGHWSFQQRIAPASSAAGDWFGYHVALEADTLVVGAAHDSGSGGAYVFTRTGTTWSEQQKLKPSKPASGGMYGCNVTLSGDTIAVGAHNDSTELRDGGATYVYVRRGDAWTEQQRLVPDAPQASANFGYVVAIYGNTLVVGAPRWVFSLVPTTMLAGEAYVFVRVGEKWQQSQILTANVPRSSDYFGASVGVSATAIVVGANGDSSGGHGVAADPASSDRALSGAAYLFAHDGTRWRPSVFIKAANPDANDFFGFASALTEDTLVIGAIFESSDAKGVNGTPGSRTVTNSGAVYVYR